MEEYLLYAFIAWVIWKLFISKKYQACTERIAFSHGPEQLPKKLNIIKFKDDPGIINLSYQS